MDTSHKIIFKSSSKMDDVKEESIDLVVTSPPYPMIEMWDEIFSLQNNEIRIALESNNGTLAFELMNQELDKVWEELYRIVVPGGIVCINIGDATRTIDKNFQLFNSHSRITYFMNKIGFQSLPEILWRKQTNAPNKFMGSGMLPPGAYVTLEHEFILIFRKGKKREFEKNQAELRRESAFFWEERNIWFSDMWDLKGTTQKLKTEKSRERSAAFPFELAYRLINMYSAKNDTVLDPFLGTGTTTLAALTSERNSVGYEIDPNLQEEILDKLLHNKDYCNLIIENRLDNHINFIKQRINDKGPTKYTNNTYGFPVITNQELELFIKNIEKIKKIENNEIRVIYDDKPQLKIDMDGNDLIKTDLTSKEKKNKGLLEYLA
jgi:DNA modification methylase